MSTELTTKRAATKAAMKALTEVAKKCDPYALSQIDDVERQLSLATAVREVRRNITPEVIGVMKELQNCEVGFLTDKEGGYPDKILRDVATVAILKGAMFCNNEFNIIGSKCYLAKNYFARKIREIPGVTKLSFTPHPVSTMKGDSAYVPCVVRVTQDSLIKTYEFTGQESIPVKVNRGMGVDAINGKCERKAYARVYNDLLGDLQFDADEEANTVEGEVVSVDVEFDDDIESQFDKCEMISDCQGLAEELIHDHGLDEATIQNLCQARCSEIRSQRGGAL